MKLLRFLLICGAILVGLLAIVLILALTPSVQTWAARRALAGQPDMRAQLGRIDVGLQRTTVTQLRVERPGLVLTVPTAVVDAPLLSAAGKRVIVRRLVAKGWILDLTAPTSPAGSASAGAETLASTRLAVIGLAQVAVKEPAPPAAAAFEGVFRILNLPVDLQVDAADLEGEIIFPAEPGQPAGRAHVSLSGGQLAAGRTGQFRLEAKAKLAGSQAPVSDLAASGVIEARMDTPRSFSGLTVRLDTTAKGPKFPNGARLEAALHAERTAEGENYTFGLRSLQGAGKQLADLRVAFPYASRQLAGSWKIDAQDADVAPFALGLPVPGFVATGEGSFEADRTLAQVHAVGRYSAMLDHLEVLQPPLAAIGRLQVRGNFDVIQRDRAVRVDQFSAHVEGARPILAIEALQGIELNPGTGELKVADPQKDLFRVSVQGLPLAWVQAFVQGVSFSGNDLRGEFVARAYDGGMTVRSVSPMSVGDLTVSQEGKLLIERVDVSTTLSADYSPAGWQTDVSQLTLSSGGTRFFSASLKAGRQSGADKPIKAAGQYDLSLPAAARQPVLSSLNMLTKGRVTGDFSAVVTDPVKQLAAKLEVRDLAAAGATRAIPNATLDVRADLQSDGLIKVRVPLVLQSGERRSDLDATAEIRTAGAKQQIDAQVTSNLLYVEDLQVLAAAFQAAQAPQPVPSDTVSRPTPPSGAKPSTGLAPDTQPFWNGLTGQLRLALKKVVYSPDVQAADVAGSVKIGPDAISLEGVRMNMGEGSGAKVNGALRFDPKAKAPYVVDGDINVSNLNPGPILAIMNPQGKPTVEGQFDMTGKFSGEAARPDTLASQVKADVKLTSRGGKFNGFAASAKASDLGRYQKATSTFSSIVGLAAGMVGRSDIASYADRARAVADIVKRFIQIDFDQLNVEISHRPGEATQIKDFSLISPELRLTGNGGIEDVPGMDWLKRPLHLDMQMAVRGDQAKDMKLLGVIREQADPLGYAPLVEKFPVDGSLSDLGMKALFQLLARSFGTQ